MILLEKVLYGFAKACSVLAGVLLIAVALIGTANVVGYAAFNRGVAGALELSASGLAAIFFLSLPLTQIRRAHVDVDIVANMFGDRAQPFLRTTALLAALMVFGLMAYMAFPSLERSIRFSESAQGSLPYPIWPVKLTMLVGIVTTLAVCALQLLRRLTGKGV